MHRKPQIELIQMQAGVYAKLPHLVYYDWPSLSRRSLPDSIGLAQSLDSKDHYLSPNCSLLWCKWNKIDLDRDRMLFSLPSEKIKQLTR